MAKWQKGHLTNKNLSLFSQGQGSVQEKWSKKTGVKQVTQVHLENGHW